MSENRSCSDVTMLSSCGVRVLSWLIVSPAEKSWWWWL